MRCVSKCYGSIVVAVYSRHMVCTVLRPANIFDKSMDELCLHNVHLL